MTTLDTIRPVAKRYRRLAECGIEYDKLNWNRLNAAHKEPIK